MGLRTVNLVSCRLEEEVDEHGFLHTETVVGPVIGARRIGASVYEAVPGRPIWPYHYHYGVEEWVYVISGTPELRDAGGRRALQTGDLVCFPSGHLGAHTLEGPGRFVIFSAAEGPPVLAVYPDSDKLATAPHEYGEGRMDSLMVRRDAGVEYWSGEGTNQRFEPAVVEREPASAPSPPVINALRAEGRLGASLGAARLNATVCQLGSGEAAAPYHYQYGREEWVVVLAGTATVRHPDGEAQLAAGEVACFPEGPAGAHSLSNQGEERVRVMLLSTTRLPANVFYPDSGRWLIRNAPDEEGLILQSPPGPTR